MVSDDERRVKPGITLPSSLLDKVKAEARRLGIPTSRAHEQALRDWLLKRPGRADVVSSDG